MSDLRHLIDWHLLDDSVWERAIHGALRYRRDRKWRTTAAGRSIGMLFFNPSLRTRTSMELAAVQLGAHATTLTPGQGTWGFAWEKGLKMDGGEAEHIVEAVGVLSRYYDALGVRLFASHTDLQKDRDEVMLRTFIEASSVPVVNLESAFYHPCQALADAATIVDRLGETRGKRFVLTWAHHPKALPMAVPNSALLMASRLGMDVVVARPEGYDLDGGIMETAIGQAARAGGSVEVVSEQAAAIDGADIVYAKAWASMEVYDDPAAEAAKRHRHADWRVTAEHMRSTNDGAFMHCLPVRRGVVVDDAVLEGAQAIHLDQAEYRLHAQKAILDYVWNL
jgi:N-acetylornithine carbamoyltransferase